MGAVGKKLRNATSKEGRSILHWCPGCNEVHQIRIKGLPPVWSFNDDYDHPSFNPSVLISVTETEDDDEKPLPHPIRRTICHYFIKRGAEMHERGANLDPAKSYIDFCGDSPHALRGKIVELPDWPYEPDGYGGIDE